MATAHARLREFLPDARELAVLFAARGLACVAAWHAGFRALSDDDYARISIAQRFAHGPTLDPSGTSWLPAPFWAYGTAFRFFGTGLGVARATAIALALCATVLVFAAARLLGGGRFGALLCAILSCLLVPYSVLLGIAAVPEVPCAALLLFAVASLARAEPNLRAQGGLALVGASLARYESWPVALIFALFCAWDALRARSPAFLGGVALALAGPALWLALGRLEHGDALFFVARVVGYRRALGGEHVSLARSLSEYPRLLFWEAPGLFGGLSVYAVMRRKIGKHEGSSYGRATTALAGMLVFLMLGSVRDGVPTHHAARVLLPIWFLGCVVFGLGMARFAGTRASRARIALVVATMTAFPLFFDPRMSMSDLAQRSREIEAGQVARRHAVSALAIDTPDYGFFAVQAAFGSPGETTVLDDHDPCHPSASPFRDAPSLDRALRERGAKSVIVTTAHFPLLPARCSEELWHGDGFLLVRCL